MNDETYLPLEDLYGDGAVSVVLLHLCGVFHSDEDNSEVVFFEEGFGEVARLPGLLLLGVGDLLEEVKLRQLVDHGAVFLGGGHFGFLAIRNMYASRWVRCKRERLESGMEQTYTWASLWPAVWPAGE